MPTRPSLTSPMIMSIESGLAPRPGSSSEVSSPRGGFFRRALPPAGSPLADDHVDRVGTRAEAGIELRGVEPARRLLAPRHRARGQPIRETEGEHVDVRDGPKAVATGRGDDRIFGRGE